VKLRAAEVAEIVGGELVGPDVELDGAGIDSREIEDGQLFVAIVAERDGHEFIDAAVKAGAPAYLTSRPPGELATAIVVPDTAAALTQLGRVARDRLGPHVVGITGSVGKTTTKDLTAAALVRTHSTHASVRSFNNELGVPLTLINAPDHTHVTVVEMGARGIGHIAELCQVARPTVGVVTAVELVHTERFGGLAAVAQAKGELVESLPTTGTAVLNADNELIAAMATRTEADVLRYGFGEADVRAEAVVVGADLRPTFVLQTPWGDAEVHLTVRGVHNVANALAAASVALVTGVDLAVVAEGLGEAVLSPWRMDLHETANGAIVVNDAYNAGPKSMEAALHALAHLDATRRVAVLGPMAELGDHSLDAHRYIGELANDLDIELIAVGAPDYGGRDVADIDAAFDAVGALGPGDAVLVKGSRVAGLEQLAARLLG
jgi:UDP-N-acetylmuramoyl-tripeptide--D-alanyl-D-alanine ligase